MKHPKHEVVTPPWECRASFRPVEAAAERRTQPQWVTLGGGAPLPLEEVPTAEEVLETGVPVPLQSLPLYDPDCFVAGQLKEHVGAWVKLLEGIPEGDMILSWLMEGVDVFSFFKHFKGNFKGRTFDHSQPPPIYLKNSDTCAKNPEFVAKALEERLHNGSLELLGRYDECEWPVCIMPLTLEPTKPRLCHDERYLNLFIKDSPFRLDTLKEAPRFIEQGDLLSTTDEKSGYDHVTLTERSKTFFGVIFQGWVMQYTTLPFGFKASCFVYHTIGQVVTSYLRSLGMPVLGYIDDRLFCPSRPVKLPYLTLEEKALRGVFAVLQLQTRLGYTFSLKKCNLTPAMRVKSLGFIVDSDKMAFCLPEDKRIKFKALREKISVMPEVDLKSLQRLAGKCASLALAVPGALLYTKEINAAISCAQKNGRPVALTGHLLQEIQHWEFLDTWQGFAPWRKESHIYMRIATDASQYGWAGMLLSGPDEGLEIRDYWGEGDKRPIHIKELEAILKTLQAIPGKITDARLDLAVDNQAVVHTWERQGSRSPELNRLLKSLFEMTLRLNLDIRMSYIPSVANPADEGSRRLSAQDASLAPEYWQIVEQMFGPHSVDLMALDSNVMCSREGERLRHFTPGPSPHSAGVNVFAQAVELEDNPYVFPPICLVAPILQLLKERRVKGCTVLVPMSGWKEVWWPALNKHMQASFCLAKKGQQGVLRLPTKKGWVLDRQGLRWDLWVVRIGF